MKDFERDRKNGQHLRKEDNAVIRKAKLPGEFKKEKGRREWCDLNARRIEVQDTDLSANITQNSKLNTVIKRSISDYISCVSLHQVSSINGDGCLHVSGAVSFLVKPRNRSFPQRNPTVHNVEPRLAVLDPYLIGIHRCEKHVDG